MGVCAKTELYDQFKLAATLNADVAAAWPLLQLCH
jgi:hypothetical protein